VKVPSLIEYIQKVETKVMGNGFLSRIQGKGRDHAEKDMGASI
jgi:hypothetical protein